MSMRINITFMGPFSKHYVVTAEVAEQLLAPGIKLSETRSFVDLDGRRHTIMMANVLSIDDTVAIAPKSKKGG